MPTLNLQRTLHWLEMGGGRKLVSVAATVLFVIVFSWFHCRQRFSGPGTETVIEEALIGKSLASGTGFTTPVTHPQAYAYMVEHHGYEAASGRPLPDLYHPPGYPSVIAAGLALIPDDWEGPLWEDPIATARFEPGVFGADVFLLAVNVFFFWLACLFTYLLGRRLFSTAAGFVALLGLLLSPGAWDQVLALGGASLVMALLLLAALLWERIEDAREDEPDLPGHWHTALSAALGVVCALLYLTEYSTGFFLLAYTGYCAFLLRGRALLAGLLPALAAFCLVVAPWSARNIELTGNPVGLAWENLPLKVGDPGADPLTTRAQLDLEPPDVDLKKIAGKGLKGLEVNLTERIWTSGATVFSGFFLAGLLYRFRRREVNTFRWALATAILALLLLQPFVNSGLSPRPPAVTTAPLIILLGAGFFFVLFESTGSRRPSEKAVAVTLLLLFQGAPLAHNLTKPSYTKFTFPPYWPPVMAYTRTHLTDHFYPGYAIMADIPAGLAWYSQQPVWGQPDSFADFVNISLDQKIGALFLSPNALDQPFFSKLAPPSDKAAEEARPDWATVYRSLLAGPIPSFFPLQKRYRLYSNIFVLINKTAERPVQP